MTTTISIGIRIALLLLVSPLLQGVINKTKAFYAGRTGAPLLQPYYELKRLFRKSATISRTTTFVFVIAPVLAFIVPLLTIVFLPIGADPAPWSFAGDGLLLLYLFALSRFFTVTAAMDTGSPFEGMGGAREVTFATLSEPTMLFSFIALTRLSGGLTLNQWFGSHVAGTWATDGTVLALLVACLLIILLVENCRLPFDDPNTHLELTMIHEVMVLDHSGPAFGLIQYGAALKFTIFGLLVTQLTMPVEYENPLISTAAVLTGLLVVAVLVGIVESTMARFKMARIPQILIGTTLVSIFATVLTVW